MLLHADLLDPAEWTIVKVIREIKAGNIDGLPPITQLSEIRVETNGAIQVVER